MSTLTCRSRTLLALAFAFGCLSCRPAPSSPPAHGTPTAASSSQESAEPATESEIPPPPPPLLPSEVPAAAALSRPLPEISAFYDALDELRRGARRSRPLRVLWLGDSHTSADFMTHRVRLRLQSLVADSGPGFLRLGLDAYRHEAVSFDVLGKWRHEPILPAQRTRVKDGVFGYGGIRTLPQAGARVRVTLKPGDGSQAGAAALEGIPLRYRVSYRLPPGAALRVRVGREQHEVTAQTSGAAHAGGIAWMEVDGAPSEPFEIEHVAGMPEVFGLFVERLQPGLVLDTVGIDGARAATPLAWESEQYVAAVAERAPDLLILAYGTNEVFDKGAVDQYTQHLVALIRRVRQGAGPIPCWIIGPMDAPSPGGGSRPRVAEVNQAEQMAARQEGCAFTSAQALMGGEGSFSRWTSARPQLARTDGIHLTIAGYRALGDLLADTLAPMAAAPTTP